MKKLYAVWLLAAVLLAGEAAGQDSLNISREAMRAFFHYDNIACGAMTNDTFYAVYPCEITVYDLHDPAFPKEIGYCLLSLEHPAQMSVYQNVGIVMGSNEIGFIDFGDLWNPRPIASIQSPNGVVMARSPEFLYVSHSDSTLETIDIRNPARPVGISRDKHSCVYSSLNVSGNSLLAAGASTALFSLANPAEPLLVDSLPISSRCVVAYDNRAYFSAGDSGIYLFGYEEERLSPISRVAAWDTNLLAIWGQSLLCSNPFIYEERYVDRITHFSLENPDNPRYLADFPLYDAGWFQGVYAGNGRSAVMSFIGMIILDSENLGLHDGRYTRSFQWRDNRNVGPGPFNMVKAGNNIIVNRKETGWYSADSSVNFVYDISNPANPLIQSMKYAPKTCLLLGGKDTLLYTWANDVFNHSYFRIYSFSQGEIQNELSSLATPNIFTPTNCCFSDSMLYYTPGAPWEIRAINITDPRRPRAESAFAGRFYNLVLQPELGLLFALVLSEGIGDGVIILNIADPAHIEEVGRLFLGHRFVSMAVKDNLLFLGDSSVTILDISNLQDIHVVSQSRLGVLGLVGNLTPIQDHLLFYDYRTGQPCITMIWEISDLQNPKIVGEYSGRYSGLLYSDPSHCILDHGYYFATYDISNALGVTSPLPLIPSTFSLSPPYPNPFNSQLQIAVSPAAALYPLEIWDAGGRRIEQLTPPAGGGTVTWDASNRPAGSYFISLSPANGARITRRVALLK